MTDTQYSEPSEAAFVFARDGETISFTRPGAGIAGAVVGVILLFPLAVPMLIQLACIFALLRRDGEVEASEWGLTLGLSVFYIPFVYFSRFYYEQLWQSRVQAGKAELWIEIPEGFRMKRACFNQGDIRAIDAWNGLRVATQDGRTACFFEKDANLELSWMAQVVRQHLGVAAQIPPKPGELAVSITGSFWNFPLNVVLGATPGKLSLRHSMCRWPFVVFRARHAEQFRLAVYGEIPLLPHDLTILTDDEGTPCLLIAPDGVRAFYDLRNGACLRVHVEGCLLPTTLKLNACHHLACPEAKEEFRIAIRHEIRASLQHAIACFYGAADEYATS